MVGYEKPPQNYGPTEHNTKRQHFSIYNLIFMIGLVLAVKSHFIHVPILMRRTHTHISATQI